MMVLGEQHSHMAVARKQIESLVHHSLRTDEPAEQLPSPVCLRAIMRASLRMKVQHQVMAQQSLPILNHHGRDIAADVRNNTNLRVAVGKLLANARLDLNLRVRVMDGHIEVEISGEIRERSQNLIP